MTFGISARLGLRSRGASHRLGLFALVLAASTAVAACGHKPPYKLGGQPEADALLSRTGAQLEAVAVPDATITLNRVARGDLAMLAQAPGRFRASVSKAGNELVSLAFSEEGYGLRYKLDDIPTGFYAGPADPCAVEALLGVPLSYDGLVALVLGGAPTLDAPYEVTAQKWDRKGGFEKLVLANNGFVQELHFDWSGGAWVFSGAEMWEASGGPAKPKKGRWLWSLEHDRYTTVDGVRLPGRTKVRAPGKRRNTLVVINYRDRDSDPPWATAPAEPTTGDPTGPDSGDEGGWEEDEGGWEEDEGGWEEEPPETEPSGEAPAGEEPPPQTDPTVGSPDGPAPKVARAELGYALGAAGSSAQPPATAAPNRTASTVPAVFRLEPSGLVERGDLCR